MKLTHLILLFLFISINTFSQNTFKKNTVDSEKVKEDFNILLNNVTNYYSYLNQENVDLVCVKEYYSKKIKNLKTLQEVVLFFESILMEFSDNHFTLNTSNNKSYRLSAPIYVILKNDKFFVENVWSSQIENLDINILGAEVVSINGIKFSKAIQDFPTHCTNKNSTKVKEWIANKIIAGTYNKARILKLKLKDNSIYNLNVDLIKLKKSTSVLTTKVINNIGVIRINDALGDNYLISVFDKVLDSISDSKAIILDLRNTPSGGNTYVAKAIMSRFISEEKKYQKHSLLESYNNQPKIKRIFVEYVTPRGKQYKKPLIVLAGRWTGSMGEGLTIGLDGLERGIIVGTEMRKLLGAVYTVPFKNFSFKYNMPAEKLFHINNTPRELFIPKNYIHQNDVKTDEFLKKAIDLLEL